MKLIDLMNKANEGYPDGCLACYFNEVTGEAEGFQSGDMLAFFIARELSENFDPTATDVEQIEKAAQLLHDAIAELQHTIDALTADRERFRYCGRIERHMEQRGMTCPRGLQCLGCNDFQDTRTAATRN